MTVHASGRALEPAALVLTLAIAFGVRVPGLGLPLIEWHGWRQTQTAYTAVLFHEGGIDLLHPQLPIFGPPYVAPMEFPIFQAMSALVMNIGVTPDLAVRLTALATFILTGALLWMLVRRHAGSVAAFAALGFFLFLPLNLLFGKASLVEYLATAGALGWVIAGLAWRERHDSWLYALSFAAGAVGMLAKPTTPTFWWLALVLFTFASEPRSLRAWIRARLHPGLVALVVGPVAIAYAWTAYADALKTATEASAFLASTSQFSRHFYYSDLAERLDPAIWRKIGDWLSQLVIGVAFVPLVPIGLWAIARSRARLLWIGLLGAAILPVLVFFGGYFRHDYYWTAVTPEVSILLGLAVAWLWRAARLVALRGALLLALAVGGVVTLQHSEDHWRRAYPPLSDYEGVLPRAQELASLSRPDDAVVIVGRGFDPDLAYYARRKALMLTLENETAHLVAELPRGRYRILSSWDPARDEIWVLRGWSWTGALGPHTYVLGAAPLDLRGAPVVMTDQVDLFDRFAATGTVLTRAPLMLACDGAAHPVPAGAAGTWLRIRSDPSAIVWASPVLAPFPAGGLLIIAPQLTFGLPTLGLSCSGAREIVVEAVLDAPVPGR